MAQKTINIGTGELTGDGESIRSAFSKANDNFTELYSNTTNVETSVDLHLNTAGATNNQILSWDGSDYVWRADNSGIALTDFVVGPETPTPAGNGEILYNNTNGMFQYTPPVLNGLTATGDTDFGSNKITYANVYATEGDLPDATVYHGMFAHVHATGAGYFAHAGLWTKLANDSQLSSYQTTAGLNSAIDTHLNQSGPTSGYVLSWDGSDYAWVENTGGGGGGGANVSVSDNPPAGTPTQGDLWWESDVGKLKIYYGSAWVDANPTGAGSSGGAATIQGLSDVNAGDTIAGGDFMLYDISSNHFAFVNFESEVNGLIDNRTGSSGHVSTQSQYTTTITTDAADPTDTAHHILGNTGSASVHNTSTGWYYGDVVSDPANPTTSVVLDIDQQRFTGAIQSDSISVGSGGGITAQAGATLDFQGTTINFGSATIMGGNAFNDVINNHLWSGSTEPTDGYVLSWNTSLLAGAGDYEWVVQSGGGGTWATLGDKDGASGPTDVVLGRNAVGNGVYSLSIGNAAISNTYGVAIGMETQAATYDINVGAFSGKNHVTTDHGYRVAVGAFAQQNNNPGDETGVGAVAVGTLAGDSNQGENAVAIGRYAGRNNQAATSIVLNATGVDLENVTPMSFVVKPIRQEAQAQALYYNPATGEVTYEAAGGGGGGLADLVDDTTPQLGGDLDTNGNKITNSTGVILQYSTTDRITTTSTGARVDGVLELAEGVNEQLSILTGATGTVDHDCSNGYIFRHTTPAADFTANLTNFYCNNNCVTSVSMMIIQGASAYIPTALQIGGTGQTISWQGGSVPAGNPNKTDVVTFTITNLGTSYDVIAQLVDFG